MVLLEGITLCSGCEKSVCLPFLRSHFRRTRLSLARLLLTSSCLLHMTRRIYLLTHLFWAASLAVMGAGACLFAVAPPKCENNGSTKTVTEPL